MSSNKSSRIIILAIFLIFNACNKKVEPTEEEKFIERVSIPANALEFINSKVKESEDFATIGNFLNKESLQIASIREIFSKKEWGIKFSLFNFTKDTVIFISSSKTLDGSVKESEVTKVSIDSSGIEMLFYNSADYFLGSGGGEVFAYLVDYKSDKIHYAHLVLIRNKSAQLFISPSTEDYPEVKNFFESFFRKDYEDLKISEKDIQLQ
ncbi:MAG: hypothetical protein KF721_08535 [Ignavibacteriaceae bacterium]|nr:hypothetical protein [Ignavibacteriaceae bacterium]